MRVTEELNNAVANERNYRSSITRWEIVINVKIKRSTKVDCLWILLGSAQRLCLLQGMFLVTVA